MSKLIHIASTMCPLGCGDVMFVQGIENHKVFCYCPGCAVAFEHPINAQVGASYKIEHLNKFAPEGIRFPDREAISLAGFSKWIVGTITEDEWYTESEINNDLNP